MHNKQHKKREKKNESQKTRNKINIPIKKYIFPWNSTIKSNEKMQKKQRFAFLVAMNDLRVEKHTIEMKPV